MRGTGIYIFKNTKEEKTCYIGQSSDLERRKYEHYHTIGRYQDDFHLNLRENPGDFEYRVLEYCNIEELDDKELYWMNWYQNEGWTLYNVCLRKMPNTRGKICSEETRKKISESNKGKQHSEESKKKMSESKKGKPRSEEAKKKISESKKGKHFHHSEEAKKKISESMKGKQNAKGNSPSGETRKKMSESKKGKHWRINPETGKREWY